jgi:cell division initiation protein
MPLEASDIEQKTFSTALRGYDLDEVDDFLDEVVAAMRELQDRLAGAQEAPRSSATGDVDEGAVGRALVTAQATADRLVAEAKEEAERILEEAKGEAEQWLTERGERKAEIEAEMEELSRRVGDVRTQLAVLATTVADKLDEMDKAIAAVSADEGGEEAPATGPDPLGFEDDTAVGAVEWPEAGSAEAE